MINNKKVHVIIPARGGSKGIHRKNLCRIGDDTLVEKAIKLAKACAYVDQIHVSTDDNEIYEIAQKHNVNTPSLRPPHLSTDTARTLDVVIELFEEMQIRDVYILLLQPTTPLRTLEEMNILFKTLKENLNNADAIVSVTFHDSPHPNKIQKIENGYLVSYLGLDSSLPRQTLPKVYTLNGAFYLTHLNILKTMHTFIPPRTLPFIMPPEHSINIDSEIDLIIAEYYLKKNMNNAL